jgi:hypothetical protein
MYCAKREMNVSYLYALSYDLVTTGLSRMHLSGLLMATGTDAVFFFFFFFLSLEYGGEIDLALPLNHVTVKAYAELAEMYAQAVKW